MVAGAMLNKLLTEMETIEIKLSFTVSLPVATVLICFLISHKGGHIRTCMSTQRCFATLLNVFKNHKKFWSYTPVLLILKYTKYVLNGNYAYYLRLLPSSGHGGLLLGQFPDCTKEFLISESNL